MPLLRYLILTLLFVASSHVCSADQLLLIRAGESSAVETKQIIELAQHYGLSLKSYDATLGKRSDLLAQLRRPELLGVLVSFDALSFLPQDEITRLSRRSPTRVSTLIFAVDSHNPESLRRWSAGSIGECRPLPQDFRPSILQFRQEPNFTGVLGGRDLPAVTSPECSLQTTPAHNLNLLLLAKNDSLSVPMLVQIHSTSSTYIAPRLRVFDDSWTGKPLEVSKVVSLFSPFLLFIKYVGGQYGWHLPQSYANLTIDDPWLIEPYGHLEYHSLLTQMQNHNFHTTIAFIPWNYDRSRGDVVNLIREHPERFSVCIHGDNHDHQEFAGDSDESIEHQAEKIKQAIARMERFHTLTGIPYDRFMVFPHSVAAEPTFSELTKYGFLGTANSIHVPAGASFPRDPVFLLRSYTSDYGNLLSMFRYSAEGQVSQRDLAVQAFLGNPLLFYGHQQLFNNGTTAFNVVADFVNSLEPDIKWTGLGDIAHHLYLVRKRSDEGFDIRMLSNKIIVDSLGSPNPTQLYIEHDENSSQKVSSLEVNGVPSPFEIVMGKLRLSLPLPPGQSVAVQLHYANDLNVARQNVGKGGLRIRTLRKVSDFRDIVLSRSAIGRKLTAAYYGRGWNSTEEAIERRLSILCFVALAICGGMFLLRRRKRKGRTAARSQVANAEKRI